MARKPGLYWYGDEVQARLEQAALRAVDETTEAGAEEARANHPGWKSVTGTAEASIRSRPARLQKRRIRGSVEGGAGEAFYFLFLELKNGAALRTAGDVVFPSVQDRLADEYRKAGG